MTYEGVDPSELTEEDMLRQLAHLYETRLETLRHASEQSLLTHTDRMTALEQEYRRRYPRREIDPERLREGARARTQPEQSAR